MQSRTKDVLLRMKRLGYYIDRGLKLRQLDNHKPFKFSDQKTYEELAKLVGEHIQAFMEEELFMHRMELPRNIRPDHGCPVFLSDYKSGRDTLLVLLCGANKVTAGQWSRRLCINESYHTGSVIPFLKWANEEEMAVLVLNPNVNSTVGRQGRVRSISYNETHEEHVLCAWDSFCANPPPSIKHIAVLAHSYGGISMCNLLGQRGASALELLRCIAFSDAVHGFDDIAELPMKKVRQFLVQECVNWRSSSHPLDKILARESPGSNFFDEDPTLPKSNKRARISGYKCKQLSAGTKNHESTTMTAFDSICKFITYKLIDAGRPSPRDGGAEKTLQG